MKYLPYVLIVLGTALAAATGARNSDTIIERQRLAAEGIAAQTRVDAARGAYCEAREKSAMPAGDGCGGAHLAILEPEPGDAVEDAAGLQAGGRWRARRLKEERPDALPAEIARLRAAWIATFEETNEVRAIGASPGPPPAPPQRFTLWFSAVGWPFVLGVLLVIGGAWWSRAQRRRELQAAASGSDARPEDRTPGSLASLELLLEEAQGLASRLETNQSPSEEDFEASQKELERFNFDLIEPLIQARGTFQTLHGMGAFADVYGPLSAGERNLNRTWSALVDRHWPEASSSVRIAVSGLQAATDEWRKVQGNEAS